MTQVLDDHIATGGDGQRLYREVMAPEMREVAMVALRKFSDLLRLSKRPKMMIDVLDWKTSASLLNDGRSISGVAKAHGVSKQAIQQASDSLDSIFPNLRTLTRRSDDARDKMRLRNSRRSRCDS